MFVPFGRSHLAVLAVVIGVSGGLIALARLRHVPGQDRIIRTVLATILISCWLVWMVFVYEQGWLSVATILPMNLCDWATITATTTLIYPNQKSYELCYFWALGGTLQALLTPALTADFPSVSFDVFFTLHGGVIVSALYLTAGLGMRPWPQSIPRVAFWSFLYLVAALVVNALFGTNFGFLTAKPIQPSLLDYLSPWPFYIGELVLVGAVSIAVLYAPFLLSDCIARKRATR